MRKCRNGWHKNWYDGVILWEPWIWCTKHRLLSFRNENRKFFTACRRTTYNKWEWLIIYTASKKRNLVYSIALYWQDFRSLNLHSNFVIFTKTLTKSCSSWLQASFDIFWVQIDPLHSVEKADKSAHFFVGSPNQKSLGSSKL